MAEEKNTSKVFELLSRAEEGSDVTVRDDQNDFPAFLDSARICRQKGGRFRLIDTGKFSVFELEWLGEAGADIYTSDEARPDKREVELLVRACSKGQAIVAYFCQGIPGKAQEKEPESPPSLYDISQTGAYLHLSNRDGERPLSFLAELAYCCRKAGAWLVYYHHGQPDARLRDLAGSGAWIHFSDRTLEPGGDIALLLDVVKRASASRGGLVLHVEEGTAFDGLSDLLQHGAFELFQIPGLDYRSPLRPLEQQSERRKLDFRVYYLFTDFLP